MTSKILHLVTFYNIFIMLSDGIIHFQRFVHYPALAKLVCNKNDVLFNVSMDTDIACSVQCDQIRTCISCMYNRDTKDCTGCSVKHTGNSSMKMAAGYQYFEKSGGHSGTPTKKASISFFTYFLFQITKKRNRKHNGQMLFN